MQTWLVTDESVSDPDYVFAVREFVSEDRAWESFRQARGRAERNGGAGKIMDPEGEILDKFSIRCKND